MKEPKTHIKREPVNDWTTSLCGLTGYFGNWVENCQFPVPKEGEQPTCKVCLRVFPKFLTEQLQK